MSTTTESQDQKSAAGLVDFTSGIIMADIMMRVPQNTPQLGPHTRVSRGPLPPFDVQDCYEDILSSEKTAIVLIATGMRQYTPETKSLVRMIRCVCRIARERLEEYCKYLKSGRCYEEECRRMQDLVVARMTSMRRLEQKMETPRYQPIAHEHVPYLEAFCKILELQIFADVGKKLAIGNSDLNPYVVFLEDWEVKKLNVNTEWLEDVVSKLFKETPCWLSFQQLSAREQTEKAVREKVTTHLAIEAVAESMQENPEAVRKALFDHARGLETISTIQWSLANSNPRTVAYSLWMARGRAHRLLSGSKQTSVENALCDLIERWFDGPFQDADRTGRYWQSWRPTEQFWIDKAKV